MHYNHVFYYFKYIIIYIASDARIHINTNTHTYIYTIDVPNCSCIRL